MLADDMRMAFDCNTVSPALASPPNRDPTNTIPAGTNVKRDAMSVVLLFEMYVRRWLRWANGGLVFPRAVAASTDGAGAFARVEVGDWQTKQKVSWLTLPIARGLAGGSN
jgi:hypothetical protein